MALRDRLEAIRANNIETGSWSEFGLDDLGTAINAPVERPRVRPWLTMWWHPRATIHYVVAFESAWWVSALAVAAGTARALGRVATRGLGDAFSFEVVLAGCVILGTVFQLVSIFGGGAILRLCGRAVGGKATVVEVRAALAWGSLPQAAMLVPWALALVVLGQEMFRSSKPILLAYPSTRWFFIGFYGLDLVLSVWALILTLAALAAVFQMRLWRVLLACLLCGTALIGTVLVGYLVWAKASPSFDAARFIGIPKPTPQLRARRSPPPPPGLVGPASPLWNQGFGVGIRHLPGATPLIEIHLSADIRPSVTNGAIRKICAYKNTVTLTIDDASEVTDVGLAALAHLPLLTNLEINDAPRITDGGLQQLWSLSRLTNVRLSNCPGVTGTGLAALASLRREPDESEELGLDSFSLSNGRATVAGLEAIAAAPPPSHLSLINMKIRDAELAHLAPIGRLTHLSLRDNQIEGSGLASIAKIPGLRELDLSGNPLTDQAVAHLKTMKGLTRLNLSRTPDARPRSVIVGKALPRVRIQVDDRFP